MLDDMQKRAKTKQEEMSDFIFGAGGSEIWCPMSNQNCTCDFYPAELTCWPCSRCCAVAHAVSRHRPQTDRNKQRKKEVVALHELDGLSIACQVTRLTRKKELNGLLLYLSIILRICIFFLCAVYLSLDMFKFQGVVALQYITGFAFCGFPSALQYTAICLLHGERRRGRKFKERLSI